MEVDEVVDPATAVEAARKAGEEEIPVEVVMSTSTLLVGLVVVTEDEPEIAPEEPTSDPMPAKRLD